MKTTLQVNISGFPFIIDEDAYSLLKNYLADIESRVSYANNAANTMSDIESRVAEIFKQSGVSDFKVVTIDNVREVIRQIGSPEIFGAPVNNSRVHYSTSPSVRKLMRDPRHKTLGGVCSGLAAYFEIDPSLFKLIFALLFIFGGSGLVAYIVLWIVIPKAKTDEDFCLLDRMRDGRV